MILELVSFFASLFRFEWQAEWGYCCVHLTAQFTTQEIDIDSIRIDMVFFLAVLSFLCMASRVMMFAKHSKLKQTRKLATKLKRSSWMDMLGEAANRHGHDTCVTASSTAFYCRLVLYLCCHCRHHVGLGRRLSNNSRRCLRLKLSNKYPFESNEHSSNAH